MSGIKVIAALLVAAILNPLCCCLELFADQPDMPAKAEHSCCSMTHQDEQQKDLDGHSSDVCPHSAEKDAQINDAPDAHSPILKTQLLLCTLFHFLEQAATEQPAAHYARLAEHSPPSPHASPFTEEYCVYIL